MARYNMTIGFYFPLIILNNWNYSNFCKITLPGLLENVFFCNIIQLCGMYRKFSLQVDRTKPDNFVASPLLITAWRFLAMELQENRFIVLFLENIANKCVSLTSSHTGHLQIRFLWNLFIFSVHPQKKICKEFEDTCHQQPRYIFLSNLKSKVLSKIYQFWSTLHK